MDPGRAAMLRDWDTKPREREQGRDRERHGRHRDITSPRRDNANRISKPQRPTGQVKKPANSAGHGTAYVTVDEQSEKFVADEDKFVLKQSKKKADIRVRERRGKPADYLAFHLRFIDTDRDDFDDRPDDIDIKVPAPEVIIEGLKEDQLQELEKDVSSYRALETERRNKDYWDALSVLIAERCETLKPRGPEGRAINPVIGQVNTLLQSKTHAQLELFEQQARTRMQNDATADIDYWESVLKRLAFYKAKAKLSGIYAEIEKGRMDQLKARYPDRTHEPSSGTPAGTLSASASATKVSSHPTTKAPVGFSAAKQSSMAPPPGTERFAIAVDDGFSQASKEFHIGEGEEVFAAEEELGQVESTTSTAVEDKYRPRKPRYFNRVQMGYEWNKYNQTHYDQENPPPKVVQGYKFNIFYPDLINKNKVPDYKIIREGGRRKGQSLAPAGEEDTCLIRFFGEPPYQDIAFRIVDKEWDHSTKGDRGFRSSFSDGTLQLHFQFKKIYYRK